MLRGALSYCGATAGRAPLEQGGRGRVHPAGSGTDNCSAKQANAFASLGVTLGEAIVLTFKAARATQGGGEARRAGRRPTGIGLLAWRFTPRSHGAASDG